MLAITENRGVATVPLVAVVNQVNQEKSSRRYLFVNPNKLEMRLLTTVRLRARFRRHNTQEASAIVLTPDENFLDFDDIRDNDQVEEDHSVSNWLSEWQLTWNLVGQSTAGLSRDTGSRAAWWRVLSPQQVVADLPRTCAAELGREFGRHIRRIVSLRLLGRTRFVQQFQLTIWQGGVSSKSFLWSQHLVPLPRVAWVPDFPNRKPPWETPVKDVAAARGDRGLEPRLSHEVLRQQKRLRGEQATKIGGWHAY